MRPRKPIQLKIIAGTARPDRDTWPPVDLPQEDNVPSVPEWLRNEDAIAEWNRLVPILLANNLLTKGCTSMLGVLCAVHGDIVQTLARGEAPTGYLVAQYRGLVNDFGLTPVAHGKVKPGGGEKQRNRFADRGKRPS